MKWNWGTGLVIGMLCFIAFIMFMVIAMTTNKEYEHDLVTENYYAKEMHYQNEIDAETNAQLLKEKIVSKKTAEGWLIQFPAELNAEKINGKVFLYRPSNQKLDFELPLVLSGSNLLIPDKNLIDGRWNITIDWEYENTPYLFKQEIVY